MSTSNFNPMQPTPALSDAIKKLGEKYPSNKEAILKLFKQLEESKCNKPSLVEIEHLLADPHKCRALCSAAFSLNTSSAASGLLNKENWDKLITVTETAPKGSLSFFPLLLNRLKDQTILNQANFEVLVADVANSSQALSQLNKKVAMLAPHEKNVAAYQKIFDQVKGLEFIKIKTTVAEGLHPRLGNASPLFRFFSPKKEPIADLKLLELVFSYIETSTPSSSLKLK